MANINIQYTADITQLNTKLDQIIQKQEQLGSSAKKAGDDMVSSNKKAAESFDPLANQLNKIGGMIVAAFSIDKIIEFSKSVIDTERKLELLQNRLNFVAGSTADGEKLFKRLVSTSKNLGINIEVLAEGMAAFGISATQAGFSAAKAEQIFLKMSAGLRAAGATSLQSQRAFFALQQMIDKGVVSAEELRRQLAEALPGATSLMVKAYNNLNPKQQVTMEQFIKLQEAGKILSREILPEFANVIEQEFAPALAGKKESLDAALDRVNTQFTLLKSNLANSAFIKTVASTISTELERVNSILNSNFTAMEKAGMVLNLFTSNRSASIIVANELIKTEEEVVKVQEEINKEGIANAKRISLLKGEEKKQALDELSRQKLILEVMVKAGTATKEQIRSFERIKATQQELFDLEVQSAANNKSSEEERKKATEQRLKDEVALAKIRVEQSEKGSIEENNARANLAQKQGDLDVFMAKSSAEMQLARVVAEKKANEEIEIARAKTADALSQDVVEEMDPDPSKDPALQRINKELETIRKNADRIAEASAAPFMSAMDKEIAATVSHYAELIKLTDENSVERLELEAALQKEIDNIRQRNTDKNEKRDKRSNEKLLRNIQEAVNTVGGLYQDILSLDLQRNDIALQSLENRLDKGLISEQQYEKEKEILLKRQFETEKSMQLARAVMSGANSILTILGGPLAPLAPVLIPIVAGITASQIAIIQSQVPGFKDGVIDLKGPGTETSDSIVSRLSKGESVMTAQETRKHKDVLQAIREDRLPSLIAEKYLIPAYQSSMNDKQKPDLTKTSMELAFQTAELVQAVKSNKVINLSDKSVNRLASAMNKNKGMDKKMRRRGL